MVFLGENVPLNLIQETVYISDVTNQPINGEGYILEDNKTFLTLEEAIMLKDSIGFSPLCTGHYLNPL